MTPGIYLLYKPVGPTSFSVVQQFLSAVRADREHKPPRICHGGTLDPFATGLLLMLVEPATRLFDYLHHIPKTYEATVRWGIETDNGDPNGQVTATADASALRIEQLDAALQTFIGWHDQVPHATSAKRIGGERAYIRAHRGEAVIMPPSHVYLHEAHWLSHDLPNHSRLSLTVRGGYYVRALARDLGRAVNCAAHLSELRRTSIGPWLDPGPAHTDPATAILVQGKDQLPWAPSRLLTDYEVGELNGDRTIGPGTLVPPEWPMPPGFPDPQAPLRGIHLDRFRFLLAPGADAQLRMVARM